MKRHLKYTQTIKTLLYLYILNIDIYFTHYVLNMRNIARVPYLSLNLPTEERENLPPAGRYRDRYHVRTRVLDPFVRLSGLLTWDEGNVVEPEILC